MVMADLSDDSCAALSSLEGSDARSLVRFIVGLDPAPNQMSSEQITEELGDPFATLLLLQGIFPTTADELLLALDAAVPEGDPLRLQQSFVVSEGSQLPVSVGDDGSTNSGLRFLVARGTGPDGPDLVVSAVDPAGGLVELVAWDRVKQGFNYYRTIGAEGQWAWAGNSRHALTTPSKGKGPFESHPSGNLIMKELKLPWVHWDSFKVHILENVFPQGDPRRAHAWFTGKSGAETCETAVVMPSIRRWTTARLDGTIRLDGGIEDPARFVEQIVTSPTVNLASSSTESAAASMGSSVDLPPSFFVDLEAFAAVDLPGPPPFSVAGDVYATSLATFDFVLTDGTITQPGDTHFAFVVPERAFEDNEVIRQTVTRGLISKRLAAALLMVDFPNPVFSARRASLLKHAPTTASIANGVSSLSDEMANNILAAADSSPSDSPEQEFAARWNLGEAAWPSAFATELNDYYQAILLRLQSQSGFDDYVRLADSRRNLVREMPIFESRLLFPETNIPGSFRSMNPDGTITEIPNEGGSR